MTRLEHRLAAIEPADLFPAAPDVSDVVLAHIPARRPVWPRLAASIAAATLAVTGTALAASPGLRHAVQDLFSLRGVVIHREAKLPPAPPGPNLHLGRRVTFAQARSAAGFHVLRPPLPGLAVYHDAAFPTPGGKVSVVWNGRRRVLTEFRASSLGFMDKTATGATVVKAVRIDGNRGYWLAGAPHEQVYRRADGDVAPDTLRLAGNTLVWEDGPLTLRLEGARTMHQALTIARSLRT